MRVFVTGGTGFIGEHLISLLLAQGHTVRILARSAEAAKQKFGDTCNIFIGDITDAKSLDGCCKDIEVVFHLAALMGHDLPSEEAFTRFYKINVAGVSNLIKECKRWNIKKFIQISSTAAMGLLQQPVVDETAECKPFTPYQVSKYQGEQEVLREFAENGFPALVVRPSMIYGPGFKGDFLTIAKLCKWGIFPKFGFGKNLSPALYISDLAEALAMFCVGGQIGEIYLVSSDGSYTLKETSDIIAGALHKKLFYIYCPVSIALIGASVLENGCRLLHKKPFVTKRNIQSVVTDRVFDITKVKNELNFMPKVSLKEGLKRTVDYYRQQSYL